MNTKTKSDFSDKPKTAVCPHCGCDEFDVNQSESKRVRFLSAKTYPYCREETVSSEGRGYDEIICGECGCDVDFNDIMEPLMGESA